MQMEGDEGVADYAVINQAARSDTQHGKIGMLDMEQFPDVIEKLAFLTGRKEKAVDDEYQRDGQRKVEKAQLDGRLPAYGNGSEGQGETGRENRLYPCAGRGAVHEGDHDG